MAGQGRPTLHLAGVEGVELIETHISWVFLAGPLVYKVKKPVVFPFLDYGTLERRRVLCDEEVRLNRRLAPSIYRGVRALVARDDGWALAEDPDDPEAAEYAVEMRRFDEEATLAAMLARGEARTEHMRELGRRLARFHRDAEHAGQPSAWPERLDRALGENFETVGGHAGGSVAPRDVVAAQRFAAAFMAASRGRLERRAADGLVRDCHGDLRAEHVIFGPEGVEIFDCVEFSPPLRQIDVGADLAFLVMDMAAAGRDDLTAELVGAYREAGGDPGEATLLAFYASYRAWVRAMVACLRAEELAEGEDRRAALSEARDRAALGRLLAWRARGPFVLVICGGAASGKSHLARHLAGVAGLVHLSSDVERKALLGLAPTERAPDSAYSAEMSERTYSELGRRALAELANDGPVIVDATFRYRRDRDAFLAALGGRETVFLECLAPSVVRTARVAARRDDASDAGEALARVQQAEFEPLDEVPAARHLSLRTDRPVVEVADDLEALLDARLQ